MKRKGSPLLICGMLLACQSALGAPPAAAIGAVIGSGVRVDGAPAPSGMALYNGDRIVTSSADAASIHLTGGGELALGTSTAARVSAADKWLILRLDRGKVGVDAGADTPIAVIASGVTVAPEQRGASYEVGLRGGALEVSALRGTVRVKGADRTVEVREGDLMKASVRLGQSPQHRGRILAVALIAAAGAGAGVGLAVAPGPTCVSSSQLNCP
jgi:ferric-dicitrate binding protein FerR (iron transport regulator)